MTTEEKEVPEERPETHEGAGEGDDEVRGLPTRLDCCNSSFARLCYEYNKLTESGRHRGDEGARGADGVRSRQIARDAIECGAAS